MAQRGQHLGRLLSFVHLQGGQLSKYSNLLEFGSESVPGYFEGVNVWPSEGSTLFAVSSWTYAAYQRLIYYVNTSVRAFGPASRVTNPRLLAIRLVG